MDLLLSPHNDDAVLFAAYTIQWYHPLVITLIRAPEAYGPRAVRESEDAAAMRVLHADWNQWGIDGDNPHWPTLERGLRTLNALRRYDRVFAPAPEEGGQPQHNRVGELAESVFGYRVTRYLTYTLPPGGKSAWGTRVPDNILFRSRKEVALRCYASQLADPRTRPHFERGLEEYYAPRD